MSRRRVSVPRRPVPVEERASGAAAFDGNHSFDIVSWLFPTDSWDEAQVPGMLEELMRHTLYGHLAWVVFVPHGFVIDTCNSLVPDGYSD